MKSTLFVVCLALALAFSNAAAGSSFRGGSSSSHSSGGSRSSPSHSVSHTPSHSTVSHTPSHSTVSHAPSHSTASHNTQVHHTPSPSHVSQPVKHTQTPTHVSHPAVQHTQTPSHVSQPVKHTQTPAHVSTPVHTPTPTHVSTPVHTSTPVSHPSGGLSVQQLQKMMPHANSNTLNSYAPSLNKAMQEAGINTPARQNAFLAQLAHESGQFKYMQELASGKAYEGRKDLGNTSPGDGVKYKGRGPIQITGKANYAAAGKALGVDLVNHPELAATPEIGFRTAAWFWNKHGLNAKADAGHFSDITKAINGCANCAQTHAAERNALFANNNKINP